MGELIERMWAISGKKLRPAGAPRSGCFSWALDWWDDEEADWMVLSGVRLLIDLVAGNAAASLRDQFALRLRARPATLH